MNTLQMNAAKALAQGWIKKQNTFLETIPVALRDEVRRQLGCASNQNIVDDISKQLLAGTFAVESSAGESMMIQIFDDWESIEYDDIDATATVQFPNINQDLATLLNVPRGQFHSAIVSFTKSTVLLTRVIDGENILQFQDNLLAVGMPEAELSEALEQADAEENNPDIEMYNITYTIPLLLTFGTRYYKEYESV